MKWPYASLAILITAFLLPYVISGLNILKWNKTFYASQSKKWTGSRSTVLGVLCYCLGLIPISRTLFNFWSFPEMTWSSFPYQILTSPLSKTQLKILSFWLLQPSSITTFVPLTSDTQSYIIYYNTYSYKVLNWLILF